MILLDMNFSRGITSGREGLEWLGKILRIDPDARVITTTAYGEIDVAVQAIKLGAIDFIVKPWNKEQLITAVRNGFKSDNIKKNGSGNKGSNAISSGSVKSRYPEIAPGQPA